MTDESSKSPGSAEIRRLSAVVERLEAPLSSLLQTMAKDRRGAGIWSLFKRGAAVLIFIFGLTMWLVVNGGIIGVHAAVVKPTIAQVEIAGAIGPGNAASADRIVPLLESLCEQENVRGLVLHINSPGGSPGDAERIGAAVDRCKTIEAGDDGRKPEHDTRRVVAVIDGLGASAAYYIAIHADRIVANPTGMSGSIGVIIEGLKYDGLMEKVGVSSFTYATGNNKAMLNPYVPDTAGQRAVAQSLVNDAMDAFRSAVVARRPHLKVDTPDLWSGRMWVSAQAKSIGLIDDIGLLEPVERAEWPKLPVQRFAPTKDFRESFSASTWIHAIAEEMAHQAVSVR